MSNSDKTHRSDESSSSSDEFIPDANLKSQEVRDLTNKLLHSTDQGQGRSKRRGRPPKKNTIASVSKQSDAILQMITKLDKKFDSMESKFVALNAEVAELKSENASLKVENQVLQQRVTKAEKAIDDIEQRQLFDSGTLDIKPRAMHPSKSDFENVCDLMERELGMPRILRSELKVKPLGANNKFLLQASTSKITESLLRQARLRRSNKLFMNEFLTRKRSKLFYDTRKFRKDNPDALYSLFVYEGKLLFRRTENSRVETLTTMTQLFDDPTLQRSDERGRSNERRPNERRPNERRPNERRSNERRPNERRPNEQRLNVDRPNSSMIHSSPMRSNSM